MKIALFSLAALMWGTFAPVQVQAQTNCTVMGNQTICNGPAGSVTCRRMGNQIICN